MIKTWALDVEVLPNFFSITFVNLNDYLDKMKCTNDNNKSIPLTKKYKINEIEKKLNTVETYIYYITDTDDKYLLSLYSFISNMKNKDYITDCYGFNNKGYDDLMISAFMMFFNQCKTSKELINKLYLISKRIIQLQDNKELFFSDKTINIIRWNKLPYRTVDIMKIFALDKILKSLKQTSINIQWYNLLEWEMPPISESEVKLYQHNSLYKGLNKEQLNKYIDRWDRYIIPEYMQPMMIYNRNDVFIVCEIVRLYIDEVRLRYTISNKYGINALSSSRSDIANKLVVKFYSQFSGLNEEEFIKTNTIRTRLSFNKIIFPFISYKTKKFKKMLSDMMEVYIYKTSKDEFQYNLEFNKTIYTIATGGLHSQDKPRILKSTDEYFYRHYDIASFYPSLMISYNISPEHLNSDSFIKLIKWIRDTRVSAKHSGDKITADALKIVINSIYGKLGFQESFLYDRLAQMKVTINGQLIIMMLIEALELEDIHVVSANTDGIVVKLYKNKIDDFDRITSEWCKKTKLEADSEDYNIYINRDINNYIVEETNNKISYKGSFDPMQHMNDVTKGYDMPIVAKAVSDYFFKNSSIMDTLRNSIDIQDFCKTQKVARKFKIVSTIIKDGIVIKEEIQRNFRYYVSKNGCILTKESEDSSPSRLCAGQYATVINKIDDSDISSRNINYKYYYNEAMKLINIIKLGMIDSKPSKLKKYSGMYNPLFDSDSND